MLHYHVWVFADNGTEVPTALYRRAKAYGNRMTAHRETLMHYHKGVVLRCENDCPSAKTLHPEDKR